MIFRFLEPAEAEFMEGIAYYAAIQAELGIRFQEAVSSAVRQAVEHPEHGAPRSKNTRRRLVHGYPFGVIYRATVAEVVIVAIAHQRKQPDYWAARIG